MEAAAMRDFHAQVQPFVGMLRAWLVKIAPGHVRSDLFGQRSLWLLAVIAWSSEVAALVLPKLEADADRLKESYRQALTAEIIADMVTGAPHADAIMTALDDAASSKRVKDVLERGLESDDPVAILNAWTAGSSGSTPPTRPTRQRSRS